VLYVVYFKELHGDEDSRKPVVTEAEPWGWVQNGPWGWVQNGLTPWDGERHEYYHWAGGQNIFFSYLSCISALFLVFFIINLVLHVF